MVTTDSFHWKEGSSKTVSESFATVVSFFYIALAYVILASNARSSVPHVEEVPEVISA